MSEQPRLAFDTTDPNESRDAQARALAIDPTRNVALEASAGTGKTRVLVDRYVGLVLSGVKPRNILAITFTRKAAAEMRQRILDDLARRHREKGLTPELWREIRGSLTDISISTIDAFCLTLLREFPLEAGVDPGFELADETETPRLVGDAIEKTLRVGRALAIESPEMALLFAELGEFRLREGLARLIDRRLVADEALNRFLRRAGDGDIEAAVARLLARLRAAFASVPGGLDGFLASGPPQAEFDLLARDLKQLLGTEPLAPSTVQALLERVRAHLLTQGGEPRKRLTFRKDEFRSPAQYERHAAAVAALGPYLVTALTSYRREINVVLARAVRRLLSIALTQYARTLAKHGVLDFSEVLARTLALLRQMDEFSRSRYKLEARYQHVLVDEFQDTSRAQWELVELLVRSWAEGIGVGDGAGQPTIFIVGDRKQSIYGFRDAEVAVLDEAARYIEALRPIGQVRTAITRSFRAVRELLAFVNDLFAAVEKAPDRADAFRYGEDDVFPVASVDATEHAPLGLVSAHSDEVQAEAVAEEIARLLVSGVNVRDRETGIRRAVRAGDIGVLFRTRESHRVFEDALARRRVPFYVYKGLGFFDADEIKDVLALLAFLANPASQLRAAAFLRSRFVRLSDSGLTAIAPDLSSALTSPDPPAAAGQLDAYDAERLQLARADVPGWLSLVDNLPPAELLDRVLADSAFAAETGGPAHRQARENLKKARSLVRRIQNRGYATLDRIVEYFSQMVAGGDESNAIVDASDAVNLMTVHAAKGLEFPILFVVNMSRGSGGAGDPIRVVAATHVDGVERDASVAIGEFQSEADSDLEARETEEAKRLLYVALTRARDRLYLGATLAEDGRFTPAKGSLGRVLPGSFGELISLAGSAEPDEMIEWSGHRFRAIKPATTLEPTTIPDREPAATHDDFEPLAAAGAARRRAVTATADDSLLTHVSERDAPSSIEAGLLVHRALQAGVTPDPGLLAPHERALVDDVDALVARATSAYYAIVQRPAVAALLSPPGTVKTRLHEVPFSLQRSDGTIVRGAIDALIEYPDGRIDVLEFKTGRPGPSHDEQLAIYVEAARALFPGAPVTGQLIYAGEQLSGDEGV